MFRICKAFHIESGHLLSKHPERCRFPHGHSRRVEIVLSAPTLDDNDMVCDFKWVKLAVKAHLDEYDHAMCVSAKDPHLDDLTRGEHRVVVFEEGDPTTELLAKRIHEFLSRRIIAGEAFTTDNGVTYHIRQDVRVERVRVSETPSTWAEYRQDL